MQIIKFKVVDDGPWQKCDSVPFRSYMNDNYKFEYSHRPDFLFYSNFGSEFLKYKNCIRIFYTGENIRPDFNQCDYAIGYDRLNFGDRYIRRPIFAVKPKLDSSIDYFNRRFCNFIYSNASDGEGAKHRIEFFKLLSNYKRIDSPGSVMNNMSGAISSRNKQDFLRSKMNFLKSYKFTIAFENDRYPGYITEKLIQPFNALSIPIYCGDPDATIDFNPDSFINCAEFKNWHELIDYIKYLDTDKNAYMKMLSAPPMRDSYVAPDLPSFFENIFINRRQYQKNIRNNILNQPYTNHVKIIKYFFNSLIAPMNNMDSSEEDIVLNSIMCCNHYQFNNLLHFTLEPLMKNCLDNHAKSSGIIDKENIYCDNPLKFPH